MVRRLLFALALGALLVSVAPAQRGGRGGGMGGGGGDFGGGRGIANADKAQAIVKELKLTDDGRKEMEAIMDEAQKASLPLLQQRDAARKMLLDANVGGQDPAPALNRLTALDTQLLGIEVDAFTKEMAKLDAKQKAKAPKLFEMMTNMFRTGDWRKTM